MTGDGLYMFNPVTQNIKHPINGPNYVENPH